jgi:solute carrier family 10 (sodium/bile acid cotransporter), member 7
MKKRPVFAIALSITFVLAAVAPQIGARLYDLGWTSTFAIMLMYAGMGMNTDTALIWKGFGQWRLHLAVQGALFVLAPLLSLAVFTGLAAMGRADRAVGLLFIGAIPTTITSCIMLTRRYGGNAIGSLYNAVLAQVLGVLLTPLILSLVLSTRFETVSPFGVVLLSLSKKMILPFLAGQIIRLLGERLGKIGLYLRKSGQVCSFYGIFFILYMNLAKVASRGDLVHILSPLAVPLAASLVLCALQIVGTWLEGLLLRLSVEDRICLLFTGSQKTLGMGVPLASIYFATRADIAMDATLVIITYYLVAMMLSVAMVPMVAGPRDSCQTRN